MNQIKVKYLRKNPFYLVILNPFACTHSFTKDKRMRLKVCSAPIPCELRSSPLSDLALTVLLWVLTLGGVFGFDQALQHQSPVELLEVRVHALPVRLPHPHHILHIQKLRTVGQLPTLTETRPQRKKRGSRKVEETTGGVGNTRASEGRDTQDKKIKKPTLNSDSVFMLYNHNRYMCKDKQHQIEQQQCIHLVISLRKINVPVNKNIHYGDKTAMHTVTTKHVTLQLL